LDISQSSKTESVTGEAWVLGYTDTSLSTMYMSTADCTTLQSTYITHDGKEGETNSRTLVIILQYYQGYS